MKKSIILLTLSISLFSQEITLGIVPQQSPLKLFNKWSKVTDYLYEKTNIKVRFQIEKSIPKFEKELYSGKYDIAYMNPYHFVVAQKKEKYKAFIRAKKNIIGIIVSNKKDIDFSAKELKGKTFLFPAPNAFAATLLVKFELKENYNFDVDKDGKVLYVNSHDSVYKGISRDVGYLGGGIIRTYNNFLSKEDKLNLNIVYKTKAYPSHPIAVHPRIDNKTIEKIKDAFLTMPNDIKKTLSIKNFRTTTSNEYKVIEQIGIQKKEPHVF